MRLNLISDLICIIVCNSDETIIADVAESIAETQPISINRIQNFESINR